MQKSQISLQSFILNEGNKKKIKNQTQMEVGEFGR